MARRRRNRCGGWGWLILAWLGLASTSAGQSYNLKLGPVLFNLTGRAGVAYDSNITGVSSGRKGDFIATAGLDLGARWDITEYNRLTTGIGIEYHKYFQYSEFDSSNHFLTILPDTNLRFTVLAGNFILEASDHFSFSLDPTEYRVVDPATQQEVDQNLFFGRFENTFDLHARWDIHPTWFGVLGYERSDIWALRSEFDSTERNRQSVYAGLNHQLAANLNAGLRGSVFWNEHRLDYQNDSSGWSLSGSLDWQVSETLNATGALGYNWHLFDTRGRNGDFSDPAGFFFSLALDHEWSPLWTHQVHFTRNFSYGYVSNIIRTDTLGYTLNYQGFKRSEIWASLLWQHGLESGGFFPETYDRYSAEAGLGYQLSHRLSWNFSALYLHRESNLSSRAYRKYRLSLGLAYDF